MNLKEVLHNILDQISTLVEELSQEYFTHHGSVFNQSTIRQHVRHTVEFFMEGKHELNS